MKILFLLSLFLNPMAFAAGEAPKETYSCTAIAAQAPPRIVPAPVIENGFSLEDAKKKALATCEKKAGGITSGCHIVSCTEIPAKP